MRAGEFFAGMGLMRAGLEPLGIQTVFANDIDATKATLYRDNWGGDALHVCDIRGLTASDIPDIDLATASFPCTDLSLAGWRKGLNGDQSGLIVEFLRLLDEMGDRAPGTIMIENVPGFLTSNGGDDWQTVVRALQELGYNPGHLMVDAASFVPQSRSRVFLFGHKGGFMLPQAPEPRADLRLASVAERDGDWWSAERLGAFLSAMSPIQSERVTAYQRRRSAGFFGAFRRTRDGRPVWEVRADERAGALRTTRGGSARQAILRAGRGSVAARWMNVMEYARLQGAENLRYGSVTAAQAMFALGDAVCVPVIDWLGRNCLRPMLQR
ncbi:MAG: DNA (cytosine-5-)-methyltransferase [Boseongicola sp. SB0676_bin_33]|uniref:DNA (cytosine-5-)-methyltransferase n=1 Tax=Boseongicola sp. SB0664_bin_43 TaxID=2604844 RepID=A0A6B0XY19_9RHOB|nr:DNA (cytosine-5-)-methyltransferase [Boseongicola sp. SB0664_bin_43]MYF90337.1 DNA (cytosine-5-)-methyltransferase [Boseongicola sp. SB0676_bin_33]